jgi:hypothetical protein
MERYLVSISEKIKVHLVKDVTKIILSFLEEFYVKEIQFIPLTPWLTSAISSNNSKDKNSQHSVMPLLCSACPNGSIVHEIETATFHAEFSTCTKHSYIRQDHEVIKDKDLFLRKFMQLKDGKRHGWSIVWHSYIVKEESYYIDDILFFRQNYDIIHGRVESFSVYDLNTISFDNTLPNLLYKYDKDMILNCYFEDKDENYKRDYNLHNSYRGQYHIKNHVDISDESGKKIFKTIDIFSWNVECITEVDKVWTHVVKKFPQDWRSISDIFDSLIHICESVKRSQTKN